MPKACQPRIEVRIVILLAGCTLLATAKQDSRTEFIMEGRRSKSRRAADVRTETHAYLPANGSNPPSARFR